MKDQSSKAQLISPYSYGYAAHNLAADSSELDVIPMEKRLFLSGELTDDTEKLSHKGVDSQGNPYEVEVNVSVAIKARWMKFGSTLKHPPFIRRGERVMIYRIADSDRYYWESLGLDDHLRRGDTYTIMLSNLFTEGEVSELDETNSYVIQASTHTGQITIQTNKKNGERYSYSVQLDTKDGYFVVEDDADNQFLLDSANTIVSLKNADGGLLSLNKKDMRISVPENLQIDAKTMSVLVETLRIVSKDVDITTGTFITKAATIALQASSLAIKASTSIIGRLTNNGRKTGSNHRHGETQKISKTPL